MEEIKNFFKRDNFSNLLGIELLEVKPGYARTMLEITPHHLNGFRAVHGGVIFTLADLACAAASNAEGQLTVLVSASINYIKSGKGGTLFAEAQKICSNAKLSSFEITISDDKGEKIASFQGLAYHKKSTLEEVIRSHPN